VVEAFVLPARVGEWAGGLVRVAGGVGDRGCVRAMWEGAEEGEAVSSGQSR